MKVPMRKLSVSILAICIATVLCSCTGDPQRAKTKYLANGQKYLKKGKYGDAAIEFRNALRLDPRFVDAYFQLAQAEIAQHDWNQAYAALQKTVELNPGHLDARLDLGRLYLAARQFDKAEDEANFILMGNLASVAAYQLLGAALIGQGNADQAVSAFVKITELLPGDSSAFVNLALVEISLHRFSPAERHLRQALAIEPGSQQAYADLANFYRLQGRNVEAQQVIEDGISKNAAGITLYIDWASMLAGEGKEGEVKAVLAKLHKQLPNSADASVAIGDFYLNKKQTDLALAEYRQALSARPRNLDIRKRIADLYLSTGETQLAGDLDTELVKEAPKDVIVRVDHGRLLTLQGKFGEAITALQRVAADAADSPEASYFLGMAYWKNGDKERARGALLDTLKISPRLPIALLSLAQLSLAQGDAKDAQGYAQELVQRHPGNENYRQVLAMALLQQGRLQQAEEQILVARQLAPNVPTVRLSAAQIFSQEKRWGEAENEFETALQLDSHNTEALAEFADFLTARKQTARALARIEEYVGSNPGDANGHIILGALKAGAGDLDSARAEFERAIQIDPKQIQAYLRLGKVYESQGEIESAVARYQQALDLQPDLAPLATMIGNLYLGRHDLETARKYYAQALGANPDFAIANANMAWIDAAENKNLDVALGMAQKAKSLMPELPSITDTLAWVMYKRGDYAAALPLLLECVRKSPENGEYHYHLGMTLIAIGQQMQGREQLQDALRMKVDGAVAQQVRQAMLLAN